MAYRTRIKYTSAQKQEIWDRWKKGESLNSIGRLFDRPSSSIFNILAPTGGIRPPIRKRSKRVLTLSEREEISRGTVADLSIRSIAKHLNRPPLTISRKIKRISLFLNGLLPSFKNIFEASHKIIIGSIEFKSEISICTPQQK